MLASFSIGAAIYLVYQFFGTVVRDLFYGTNKITIFFTSVLIMVLLFGIQYFLKEIKAKFAQLEIIPERADKVIPPIDLLHDHFTTSKGLYLLILISFLPFIAIKINALYSGYKPFFYLGEPTFWAAMLDIYNESLSYFILYLLAIVLWMIFNISWVLSKINNKIYYESLKIKPLDTDKVGGLRSIRDLILKLSIYYFIIIILTMSTYLTYRGLLLYEGISLIIFWLIGAVFSIMAWLALRRILKRKIEKDILLLNETLEGKRLQLIDIITKNKEGESQDQMNSLSKALDIVNKERDRILQYKIKPIDAKSIILFVSSSLLSLLIIVKELEGALEDAGKSKIIMFAVSQSQPYLGDSISTFLQYFSK